MTTKLITSNPPSSKSLHSFLTLRPMAGLRMLGIGMLALMVSCAGRGQSDSDGSGVTEDTLTEIPVSPDLPEMAEDTVAVPAAPPKTTSEVLALMESLPDADRYRRGILPRMAEEVPEYAGKLLLNDQEGFLIVDKNTMKLYRYDRYGVEQERVGIACSRYYGTKHKRRDNRTPEGFFTIEGIYDSTDWLYTDDDGNTSEVKGQFGPRFMRLRTPVSSQIGIHGTVAPWSIGGRRSHGCIRMTNENIMRISKICKPGWPVIVSPGPRDMKVNEDEEYDVPSVTVALDIPRARAGKWNPEKTRQEAEAKKAAADSLSRIRMAADTVSAATPEALPAQPADHEQSSGQSSERSSEPEPHESPSPAPEPETTTTDL
ncbi:MAG: L,D-transpeptidase [Bacteroides sp.]|nr:L,D-transpeptidase [Bacteroides sp.]